MYTVNYPPLPPQNNSNSASTKLFKRQPPQQSAWKFNTSNETHVTEFRGIRPIGSTDTTDLNNKENTNANTHGMETGSSSPLTPSSVNFENVYKKECTFNQNLGEFGAEKAFLSHSIFEQSSTVKGDNPTKSHKENSKHATGLSSKAIEINSKPLNVERLQRVESLMNEQVTEVNLNKFNHLLTSNEQQVNGNEASDILLPLTEDSVIKDFYNTLNAMDVDNIRNIVMDILSFADGRSYSNSKTLEEVEFRNDDTSAQRILMAHGILQIDQKTNNGILTKIQATLSSQEKDRLNFIIEQMRPSIVLYDTSNFSTQQKEAIKKFLEHIKFNPKTYLSNQQISTITSENNNLDEESQKLLKLMLTRMNELPKNYHNAHQNVILESLNNTGNTLSSYPNTIFTNGLAKHCQLWANQQSGISVDRYFGRVLNETNPKYLKRNIPIGTIDLALSMTNNDKNAIETVRQLTTKNSIEISNNINLDNLIENCRKKKIDALKYNNGKIQKLKSDLEEANERAQRFSIVATKNGEKAQKIYEENQRLIHSLREAKVASEDLNRHGKEMKESAIAQCNQIYNELENKM